MSRPAEAVLLMAYGTPRRPEEVEAYYTDVRRGRPPPPDLLDDLRRRYDAIGGLSPLRERTEAQRRALAAALDRRAPGRFRVEVGLKHAPPRIEDTVDRLVDDGVRRIVALVLAPHYSALSVGEYLARARRRAAERDPTVEVAGVESWATEPAYVDFLAGEVRRRLSGLPAPSTVVFTAHSLPRRIVDAGDPYPEELRATATAVAARAGLDPAGWTTAWQDAGRTPEPWLEPGLLATLRDLADGGAAAGVLVCPCGFVSDHLEVLYDVDVEARGVAEAAGLAFARTAVVNDDPAVADALTRRVLATASERGAERRRDGAP